METDSCSDDDAFSIRFATRSLLSDAGSLEKWANAVYEVHPNLFVGSDANCFFMQRDDWAVVHACKSPCHQRALDYRRSLSSSHPNYLFFEKGNHLFLNIIDPYRPLFKLPLFTKSLEFIEKHISRRKVLIHCNEGYSRSPSLALLYLAKRVKTIDGTSFDSASQDFRKLFPHYRPKSGIVIYLKAKWKEID